MVSDQKKPLISHIESLGFNRTAATLGERKVVNYIENELSALNISSKIDYFRWIGPNRIVIRILYLIILSYMFIFRLYLLIAVYFVVKFVPSKMRHISLIEKKESRNLSCLIPSLNKDINSRIVILTAHHDSILSRYPYRVQKRVNLILRVTTVPYYIFILVLSVYFSIFLFFELEVDPNLIFIVGISSILGLIIIIPMMLYFFGAKSGEFTGSIDNASGISVLLELANRIKTEPLKRTTVLLLWTGAEEFGTKGAKHFCKLNMGNFNDRFDLNRSALINIDMVGSYIGLVDKNGILRNNLKNEALNKALIKIAKEENLVIQTYSKNYKIKSDHNPFFNYSLKHDLSFNTCCIHSVDDSRFIHSLEDTPDKCSEKNLQNCAILIEKLLRKLDANQIMI